MPEPPKKDYIKLLENQNRILRYEAVLDTNNAEDQGRKFVLSYRLSDDSISVFESPVRNSGVIGGKFLENSRIAKPGSSADQPVFYGPQDISIGTLVCVFICACASALGFVVVLGCVCVLCCCVSCVLCMTVC